MNGHDPKTPVPVTLELHEVIGLAVLYEQAPADLSLLDDGCWYGRSVDTAMLRIADAMAKATGNTDVLLRSGAIWARIDQERARDSEG